MILNCDDGEDRSLALNIFLKLRADTYMQQLLKEDWNEVSSAPIIQIEAATIPTTRITRSTTAVSSAPIIQIDEAIIPITRITRSTTVVSSAPIIQRETPSRITNKRTISSINIDTKVQWSESLVPSKIYKICNVITNSVRAILKLENMNGMNDNLVILKRNVRNLEKSIQDLNN